ncbi:MAG: TauD/TfdA family dioxygenase [Alphaproteobacteria bacterium]|nr:TauD/TfdA family dioxygenase [Alphaproteobacteria bacterium]
MVITVKPLHPLFAGEVSGVDLRQPVDAATLAEIVRASDRFAVLVFPEQALDDARQIAFSGLFGPLETTRRQLRPDQPLRLDAHMSDVSNLDEKSRLLPATDSRRMGNIGNQLWHTDSTFKRIPARYSLLSAHVIPTAGGNTEFADMRAAYDALPQAKRDELEGLVAIHSIYHSRATVGFTDFTEAERAALPPVPQTLVRLHPGSGRKSLYLASHASEIEGMPLPEGRMLLLDLMEHATQRQFVYTHRWRVGDLVMWDNRCTMHRARSYNMAETRDMRRTTVSDGVSSLDRRQMSIRVAQPAMV